AKAACNAPTSATPPVCGMATTTTTGANATTTTTPSTAPTFPTCASAPCRACGDYVGGCLPDLDGMHDYCIAFEGGWPVAESDDGESDAMCPADYGCVHYDIFFTPPISGCFATCGVYTCGTSSVPTCGGSCPDGEVCGQLSGKNVCGCARPD